LSLLEEAMAPLDEQGVPWWLDFGSALTAYRDGQLRGDDLDIGVWWEDVVAAGGIPTNGLEPLYRLVRGEPQSLKLSGGPVPVDIHFYRRDDEDQAVTSVGLVPREWPRAVRRVADRCARLRAGHGRIEQGRWPYRPLSWVVPSRHFARPQRARLDGTTVPVPADTEAFLALHYGADWRTPRSSWVWWQEDGSIRWWRP
jgi:hypothetical protein